MKAAVVVGHCGKAIVGGIDESVADWFMGLAVYDGATNDGVFRGFGLCVKRACGQGKQKGN